MKRLALVLALAGCGEGPSTAPAPVDASLTFVDGELDCPGADSTHVYDPDLEFPKIAQCYWRCALGYEQPESGQLLLLLVDDALAAWRPQEPRLTAIQSDACSESP